MTATAVAFDVCGALPTGTTVLEASAGTGKTFTIAALAARYVAEGRATLPELMLVTFGREATHELRERVRERLVSAERGLADPQLARASCDRVLALLADVADDEVALRRGRLATALAQFDAATIATTHQFCQQMLTGLGIIGDSDPDAVFVTDIDDLVEEVVDDFYVRKYAQKGDQHGDAALSRELAGRIARGAVTDGQARLEPRAAPAGSAAQLRWSFADAVRREVERRKRRRRTFSYDDMLTRLSAALRDPSRGETACSRLRERYRVVLVDEFQDTDPVQWHILRTAFHGHTDLVLIGDPKQAIYAFRGADVVSYLAAAERAGNHATLAVNWRSDGPLLTALGSVFCGAALGDERIVVRSVDAAYREQRLVGAPVTAPLRLRVVGRSGLPQSNRHLATVGPARERVATDVAGDVAALLAADCSIGQRPVAPGDVAVLVRTNAQGDLVRAALAAAGVPAVLTGTASVFAAPTAAQWLTLLEALEQPHRTNRVRAAALTCFLGWTVADLDGGGDGALEEIGLALRHWVGVLADRGVAALVEAVTAGIGLPQRLLAATDGERQLTDLRHIGQALHAAAVDGHLGATALVGWLRRRIAEAGTETAPDRSRRLESDADAVQVVTVHRSKGLEFPIVYVPFGWDRYVKTDPDLLLLHDGGHRVLDVGGSTGPGWRDRLQRHLAEEAGEDLRLLYVAMTRAQCQVVAWWAPTTTTGKSPLHRLLFGRPGPGADPPASVPVGDDSTALRQLQQLAPPALSVEATNVADAPAPLTRWQPPAGAVPSLHAATFQRRLDLRWRRTSYSALIAETHGAVANERGVGSEPEDSERDDETMPPVAPGATQVHDPMPSPMADLPTGASFGTLVHAVLEAVDPAAPDLLAELTARVSEQLIRRPTAGLEAEPLAAALLPSLQTPLGPLADDLRLADVAAVDRLSEIGFELPLAGGDRPTADIALLDVAQLLRRHLDPADPLGRYPDLLETPALSAQRLRGYLTGSVDAVLRISGGAPGPRFLVVDYKTNWLGEIGPTWTPEMSQPLTAGHYSPPALADAMIAAHYPLQALLYSVALHRFLRWRQPGYLPDRHLGGVLYLFLRGMCGRDTPTVDGVPCGVFSWRPPAALITDLSQLLDEGAT